MSALSGKVLCINARPLGNSVCTLPEIQFLSKKHGQPVDILIKNPSFVEIYNGIDYVGQVFLMQHWSFWPWLLLRMLSLQKKMKYEHIYLFDLAHMRKFLKIFSFSKDIPHQIRLGFSKELRESRKHPTLMASRAVAPSVLITTEQERGEVRQLLNMTYGWNGEPIILFHPGCSHVAKGKHKIAMRNSRQWPVEYWQKTLFGIKALVSDAMFIITGTANERRMAEEILKGTAEKTVSLAGSLPIRRLLALQSIAHSCISIDTGAAHTAMSVGCPVIILYDCQDPRYMGECSPKGWGPGITIRGFRNREDVGLEGYMSPIKNILPETVINLWQKLPSRSSQPLSEHFVSHYCEGDMEPEVLPILF